MEALLAQVKTLTIDATKYNIRSAHLGKLLAARHHTAWAVGTKPYPPFIQTNPRLLGVIREIRNQAARSILEAAQDEFTRQATNLREENDAILTTVEALQVSRKDTSLLSTQMEDIGLVVSKVMSTLEDRLAKRHADLALRQPAQGDWDKFFQYLLAAHRANNSRPAGSPAGRTRLRSMART